MNSRGRKHTAKWLCLILILALALSGCGLGNGVQEGSRTGDGDFLKIGLVTGQDGTQDPIYQKAWDGFLKAEQELNVGIGYIKAKNVKEYPAKMAELKSKGYQVIVTIGVDAVEAVLDAAAKNPETKYICLDSSLTGEIPANVLGVTYKVEEASFLAGYLAGKMTKSRVVGFISGDNKDNSLRYYYGYKAGLRLANPGSEMMKGLAGTFTNKERLKVMTERMLKSKADVVFHVAGSAGKGMIETMAQAGKYSIGAYEDQSHLAPDSVLTSVIVNHDEVVYKIIEKLQNKTLTFGQNSVCGLAENAVSLAEPTAGVVPDAVYAKVLEYKEKITAGELVIPATENEYLSFTDN